MLQPRICLLGVLPFRPIIRIGCRATPAECGLDRQAARARQIGCARTTRLHGSVVLWLGARLLRDIGGVTNQRQQQHVRIVRVSMLDLRCVALYCVLRSCPADGCYRCSSMSLCRNRFGIDGAQSPVSISSTVWWTLPSTSECRTSGSRGSIFCYAR